jgi:hypothetical protein
VVLGEELERSSSGVLERRVVEAGRENIEAERPCEMDWEYLNEGPEGWRVRLTNADDA